MGRLHVKAAQSNYKEHNRRLKEEIINDIGIEEIMQEIIKELTAQRNTQNVDREHGLVWFQAMEML